MATTLLGTGSGPANPTTAVGYEKLTATRYWRPFQFLLLSLWLLLGGSANAQTSGPISASFSRKNLFATASCQFRLILIVTGCETVQVPSGADDDPDDLKVIEHAFAGYTTKDGTWGLQTEGSGRPRVPALAERVLRSRPLTVSAPGIFTNTQQNEYAQSLLNSCSPSSEWYATQGTFATDALTGCVASPKGARAQANAVAGYASGNPGSSIVGGYFQGRCLANGCNGWGSNSVIQDVSGLTSDVGLFGVDVNVNPLNVSSAYSTVVGYNAALAAPNSGSYGNGFICQLFGSNPGTWNACFQSASGATTEAYVAGYQPGSAPQPSQTITFINRDSAGVGRSSFLSTDTSGRLNFNGFSSDVVVSQQGSAKGIFVTAANTASRSYSFPDASGNVSLARVEYCGSTSGSSQGCAETVEVSPIIIFGEAQLNRSSTQMLTRLPFTNSSSYSCTGSDVSTAAGIVSFNTYAAASVTIQESGGATTDHVRFICIGF